MHVCLCATTNNVVEELGFLIVSLAPAGLDAVMRVRGVAVE